MKSICFGLLLVGGLVSGGHAQYAFVTGATPPPAPAPSASPTYVIAPVQQVNVVQPGCGMGVPCSAAWAQPRLMPAATVSYSVFGDPYLGSCPAPPVIYHVPARNVVYFGRPESHMRNYLNGGYPRSQSSVVYFGRGEAVQRGYYFDSCR